MIADRKWRQNHRFARGSSEGDFVPGFAIHLLKISERITETRS